MIKQLTIVALTALLMLLWSCQPDARTLYHQGSMLLQGGNYAEALVKFDAGLARQPDSKVLLYGRARALYGLKRFEDALPAFESFLQATQADQATYSGERRDAEFYRDRCKQELGIEVPQDPAAIPEEKMQY